MPLVIPVFYFYTFGLTLQPFFNEINECNMSFRPLNIFNTLSGEKELFQPLLEGRVGMYVCGPTVYNDVHLGNCRTFISFDVVYRYLLHLGYKVRYVRNITDVGHLDRRCRYRC
jgi:hypothetical protein